MDTCPSLNVCLQLLDAVVPATDDGEGSNSEVLARDLSRFGDAAKHELPGVPFSPCKAQERNLIGRSPAVAIVVSNDGPFLSGKRIRVWS